MKNTACILLGIFCVSISACATKGPSLPKITEVETSTFIKQVNTVSNAENNAFEAGFNQGIGIIAPPAVEWIQPLNKTEACLIFFGGSDPWWNNDGFETYWDGSCRDGYAYGTGREFVSNNDEYHSSLATYRGGKKQPEYFLVVNYDRNTVAMGVTRDSSIYARSYFYGYSANAKYVIVQDSVVDASEKRVYRRTLDSENDLSQLDVRLPNGYLYGRTHNVSPISYGTSWGVNNPSNEIVGYSVGIYHNPLTSSVTHTEYFPRNNTSKRIQLPQSYLNHITEVHNGIDRVFQHFYNGLNESMVVINKYKRRICKGDVSVSYVDDELYGRICLEHGELTPYMAVMAKSNKEQQIRHERERATIEQQLAQRSRNQQIAAAQKARDVADFQQSLNSFNESIRQNNESLRQMTNSWQPPTVDIGQPRESTTTCNQFGSSMVRCKTQY